LWRGGGGVRRLAERASVVDFPRKTGRGNTVRRPLAPPVRPRERSTQSSARDRYPTDRISNSKSSTTAEQQPPSRRRSPRENLTARIFFLLFRKKYIPTVAFRRQTIDRLADTFSGTHETVRRAIIVVVVAVAETQASKTYTLAANAQTYRQTAMVLSDVNGNGKKSAAERWLRQRNGQRASAVRCIFGPPEKRAHLMVIMRNEAEMERKRIEFAARYEPVGMSPSERRNFFAGLMKSPPTSSLHHHYNSGKYTRWALGTAIVGAIIWPPRDRSYRRRCA